MAKHFPRDHKPAVGVWRSYRISFIVHGELLTHQPRPLLIRALDESMARATAVKELERRYAHDRFELMEVREE
jgi:hypothetical protein